MGGRAAPGRQKAASNSISRRKGKSRTVPCRTVTLSLAISPVPYRSRRNFCLADPELAEDLVIQRRSNRPSLMQGNRYRTSVRMEPPLVAAGLAPAFEAELSSRPLKLPARSR